MRAWPTRPGRWAGGGKRPPVVDQAGRLGADRQPRRRDGRLHRPDRQIRNEVTQKIIAGKFALDPDAFEVTVNAGIVTVTGQVQSAAIASALIGAVDRVEAVVDVRDRVTDPPQDLPKTAQSF